jgi:hypothetical protein
LLLPRVVAADVVFRALPLCFDDVKNFGQDEVHLWMVGLSTHHVDPTHQHDDVRSEHVVLSDDLLKGVKYHVLVLRDALWDISENDFETVVEDAQSVVFTF